MLQDFIKAFEALARETLVNVALRPRLKVDCEYPLRAVDFQTIHRLAQLEPYGQGNREPSLLARNCRVKAVRSVGKDGSHLKLTLEDEGCSMDAIAFGLAHKKVGEGEALDVVYIPEINRLRRSTQVRVKALGVAMKRMNRFVVCFGLMLSLGLHVRLVRWQQVRLSLTPGLVSTV